MSVLVLMLVIVLVIEPGFADYEQDQEHEPE
jgi:hypothetical protein